jgi:hypothetical protein
VTQLGGGKNRCLEKLSILCLNKNITLNNALQGIKSLSEALIFNLF